MNGWTPEKGKSMSIVFFVHSNEKNHNGIMRCVTSVVGQVSSLVSTIMPARSLGECWRELVAANPDVVLIDECQLAKFKKYREALPRDRQRIPAIVIREKSVPGMPEYTGEDNIYGPFLLEDFLLSDDEAMIRLFTLFMYTRVARRV